MRSSRTSFPPCFATLTLFAGKSIKAKWSKTLKDNRTHREVYDRARSVGPNVTPELREVWERRIEDWDRMYEIADRDRDETGKSNDVFGLDKDNGERYFFSNSLPLTDVIAPTRAEIQAELVDAETAAALPGITTGTSSFIVNAFRLEQDAYVSFRIGTMSQGY